MLLKATTAKSAWFATIGILVMGLNFKIMFVIVFLVLQGYLLILAILLLLLKELVYCWVIVDRVYCHCIICDISKS